MTINLTGLLEYEFWALKVCKLIYLLKEMFNMTLVKDLTPDMHTENGNKKGWCRVSL